MPLTTTPRSAVAISARPSPLKSAMIRPAIVFVNAERSGQPAQEKQVRAYWKHVVKEANEDIPGRWKHSGLKTGLEPLHGEAVGYLYRDGI